MQSQSPAGSTTPTWAALYGTLQYANDYQDQIHARGDRGVGERRRSDVVQHQHHRHLSARRPNAYNGVRTFVITPSGSTIANLDQIAAAGGTMAAYDVTNDIMLFQQKMDEIGRTCSPASSYFPIRRAARSIRPRSTSNTRPAAAALPGTSRKKAMPPTAGTTRVVLRQPRRPRRSSSVLRRRPHSSRRHGQCSSSSAVPRS